MENANKLVEFKEIAPLIEEAMKYQSDSKGTVFIYIQGHIDNIDIDFHEGGWSSARKATRSISLCISEENFDKDILNDMIKDIIEFSSNAPTGDELKRITEERDKANKLETFNRLKQELGL